MSFIFRKTKWYLQNLIKTFTLNYLLVYGTEKNIIDNRILESTTSIYKTLRNTIEEMVLPVVDYYYIYKWKMKRYKNATEITNIEMYY